MDIKEILDREDLRLGDVIYDKTLDKHFMLAVNWAEFDTFACVIDLEYGAVIKDYTVGNSIGFWEDFFGDDDVELVDELTAVRETEEEDDNED
ncbi:hypothetical protein [Ligilactobacillus salivarius]|uniref:hypothetical protein n=1 Tax=Ligilactobacillus salivarius TaxID=1624 RepID=UPI00136E0B2F|nr:hypothetical protein [Ligilactobacillus salivarius]MYV10606.1 hypothetical protein [Ligilactobacillus salivarius]